MDLPSPSRAEKIGRKADGHLQFPSGVGIPRPQEGSIDFLSKAPRTGPQTSSLFGEGAFLRSNHVKPMWVFCLGEGVKSYNGVSRRKFKCSLRRFLVRGGSISFLVYKPLQSNSPWCSLLS